MKKNWRKHTFNSFTWKICGVSLFFLLLTGLTFAQEVVVKGIVTDSENSPIVGVTVSIPETSIGTITNSNGEYSISVPEGTQLLNFSFVGLKTQKVKIGKRKNIDVQMLPDEYAIEEVVAIGYGTKTKANLVTSIAKVTAEEVIADRAIPSATNALQGTVAGVNVTTDRGIPGEGFEIDIRGQSSVNYAGVHVVLDGIPSDMSAIYNINPADIESISVLKDAASTAIYGSRGAGGVILVTTKKAKKAGITVSYTGNASIQTPSIKPKLNSSYQHALNHNLAFENAGQNPRFTAEQLAAIEDPSVDAILDPTGKKWFFTSNTDWFEMMYDQAFQQNHNIAVSGGGQRTKYRLSLGYLDQNGFFSEYGPDNYSRINSILDLNTELSSKLKLDLRLNYTKSDRNRAMLYPDAAVYTNGNFLPVTDENGEYARYDNRTYNPIQVMEESGFRNNKDDKLQVDATLTWTPVKDLTLKAIGSYGYTTGRYTGWARAFGYYGPNGLIDLSHRGRNNSIDEYMQYQNKNVAQFLADYKFDINAVHKFNVTGVWVAENDGRRQVRVGVENIVGNEVPSFLLGDMDTDRIRGAMNHGASISGIGRLSYNYDNRYLLEVSGGAEASYKFSPENRWALFPAVSGGWRISNEEFMKQLDFVNQLKLRVSWGQTGNSSGIGSNDYISTYSMTTPYSFDGNSVQGIVAEQITTTDKEWERITMVNYGLDAEFFNNRLYFVAELFKNSTDNMLISKEIPSVIGNSGDKRKNPVGNYGSYEVSGWEFSGGWRDRFENSFRYDVKFNLSNRDSKITSLDSDIDVESSYKATRYRDIEGYPAGWNYFGYESAGLFRSQEEVDNWATQDKKVGPGDIKYVDQLTVDTDGDGIMDAGDGKINNDDVIYLGNMDQHYNFGVTLSVGYKAFDLKCLISGVGKQKYFMDRNAAAPFWNKNGNYSYVEQNDFWTEDNPDAWYPRPYVGGNHNYVYSDYWMIDASFVRLTDLTLGYNIPPSIVNKLKLSSVRITLSGQNLLTLSSVPDHIDPSMQRFNTYPSLAGYSVGLNVTF